MVAEHQAVVMVACTNCGKPITRVNARTDALCGTCRSIKWKAADKFLRQVDTGKATPPPDWEQTNCHSCGRQVWRHPNRKSPRALCHTCADLGSRRHRDAVRAAELPPLRKVEPHTGPPPTGIAIYNPAWNSYSGRQPEPIRLEDIVMGWSRTDAAEVEA